MRKFIQNKLKDQKGLTLIELLAVIVILAIIAAIAIPAIGNIINNSRVGAVKSDAQNALAAAELLLIDEPDFFTATTSPANDGKILLNEIESDYLDDAGSFEGDASFEITKLTDGQLIITGTGTIGSVQVKFIKADKGTINGLKNSAEIPSAAVTADNTATVIKR